MEAVPLKKHHAYCFKCLPLARKDGGGVVVYFPDLPGCLSFGDTPEEAIVDGYDAVKGWIEVTKEFGQKVPEPLFKFKKTAKKIKLSDGCEVSIGEYQNKATSESEKALAFDEAMKEFLGV